MKGFSFIELLLVISLVLVLGTLSTAFTSRFFTQNSVANVGDQLVNDLRKAQINAMMGKSGSHWGVNYASNTLTLYRGNAFAQRVTAVDETFAVNSGTIVSGLTDINFWPKTGTPSAAQAITISGTGTTKTITVNAQGESTR